MSSVLRGPFGPFSSDDGLSINWVAFWAESRSFAHAAKLLAEDASDQTHAKSDADIANRNTMVHRKIVIFRVSDNPPNTMNLKENWQKVQVQTVNASLG